MPAKKLYERTWFSVPMVVIICVPFAMGVRKLGIGDEFNTFVLGFVTYSLMSLRWPRLWPWMHRNLRVFFRLDEPTQKRQSDPQADH